jgi:hypothetical protein
MSWSRLPEIFEETGEPLTERELATARVTPGPD